MSTTPRTGACIYGSLSPTTFGQTWLEAEAFCYPRGSMTRRARIRFPDGKLRVVRCGIADTWFSIPIRKSDADGFITLDTDAGELVFNPHRSN